MFSKLEGRESQLVVLLLLIQLIQEALKFTRTKSNGLNWQEQTNPALIIDKMLVNLTQKLDLLNREPN